MQKIKSKLLSSLFALTFLFFVNTAKAGYLPWYQVDMTHPAYWFAHSFNSNPDYVRGFCFAWEAIGGQSYQYGVRTIELGGSRPLTITIGETISPAAYAALLSSGWFYRAATLLRTEYIPTLTNQDEIDFYNGYANLLEQVSYNPMVINLSSGYVM